MSQGSILEHLLFIVYIHGSPIASDLFNFIAHADDVTLTVFSQHGDLTNNINEE